MPHQSVSAEGSVKSGERGKYGGAAAARRSGAGAETSGCERTCIALPQTGRPPPAGATLLMSALKAGRSSTFLRKGMRLRQGGGSAAAAVSCGRLQMSRQRQQHPQRQCAPQEGEDGGEEGGEEQPEAPHLQRKPCGAVVDGECAAARANTVAAQVSPHSPPPARLPACLPPWRACPAPVRPRLPQAMLAHLQRSSPRPPAPRRPGTGLSPCSSWAAQRSAAPPAALSSAPRPSGTGSASRAGGRMRRQQAAEQGQRCMPQPTRAAAAAHVAHG